MSPTLRIDHALDRAVSVTAGDVELFTYTYRPDTPVLESPKPYLHPIRTLAGDVVSLFRPHDHVWHKGIAWSLPHVGEHNFWGGPTYVHGSFYVQMDNNGSAVHREMTALAAAGQRAQIGHRLDWRAQNGEPVIDEHRVLTVEVVDEGTWVLIFDTTMNNVSGAPLDIGSPTTKGRPNAGYGGLFWRGPRSFTGGIVQSATTAGSGNDLRGTRAEWLGFRGQHDETGEWSTLVMVDDAANPQHPPLWFTRTEEFACLCPAPFFDEETRVDDGDTIRFRYAVVVATGDRDAEGTAQLAATGRDALAAARNTSAVSTPDPAEHSGVVA
ncbi:PmoA family protein [Phytoactinopolyspora mesophila]|uniref:Oxidoreductase n=1 Tax=Phytoactinopolyspora mesophila TaxID=2650750 RepID=A0A7K3M8Z9_9ACTN|nr:PmoA family protein [Phytoactinopolyspora mesophila]NDL59447.1 hypothetical protein [Phytoactinopolyspora mesophila]